MTINIFTVLAILFLLVVAIVLIVLFLPVRYAVDGDLSEKNAFVRVNWLFRIIRFRLTYREGLSVVLHILCFKIDFTDPEAKEKRRIKKQQKAAKKARKALKKKEKERAKWRKKHGRSGDFDPEAALQEMPDESFEAYEEVEKDGLTVKLQKILGKWPMVKKIISALFETQLLSILWPKIMTLMSRIMPKQIRGDVTFGFSDPSTTGKVIGGICMVPVLYETELMLCPDFECDETYFSGDIHVKGRIQLIHILIFAISCIREKQVRRFIKLIRKKS